MLRMTLPALRRASSRRARCPSWRAPMVGTSPMVRPAARSELVQERSCVGVVSSFKAVLPARVHTVAHLSGIGSHRLAHLVAKLSVVLEKLRGELLVQAEHVVQHQNLTVALGSRADADSGNGQDLRDPACQRRGNQLENDGTC